MDYKDLIFIVGRQRSGTTVVRGLFKSHGALDADEIFHGNLSRPYRFYNFVLEKIKTEPSCVNPSTHGRLFRQYLEYLRTEAKGSPIVIDLKYFAFNAIPSKEDVGGTRPFLPRFLRRSKSHIIHVVRLNKLRIHVSELLAVATGQWSVRRVDQLVKEKPSLTLNPRETLARVNALQDQEAIAKRMLGEVSTCREFVYEKMFDSEGLFEPDIIRAVESILNVTDLSRTPQSLPMNPEPLASLITNYPELAAAFRGTPNEWMLEEAPTPPAQS